MKHYIVKGTKKSKSKLRKYISYLNDVKGSHQAAQALLDDFNETQQRLETLADILKEPFNEKLRDRGLKRINFKRHNYFLLFRINGDVVEIVDMFHGLEDYENKL